MVLPTIVNEFLSNSIFLPILAGVASFFLSSSIYLYPVIINVSNIKGLMDTPDSRKMHKVNTPTLGGLGIFLAFSLSVIVFTLLTKFPVVDFSKLLALLGSAIILVFLGIKDDLTGMSPKKKLMGQLFAVSNVILLTDVRIMNFEGLLGVHELPYFASVLFSVFVFVLVINALNLIDGIDGLAGSISIIASTVFGVLFALNDNYMMALISFILTGSIFGFLKYNLSNDKKIFMGDSGSLLTGFLLAYQGICFLNTNGGHVSPNIVSNAPIILLAILSYPLFDLLRVFSIRIRQGRSPFSADANHIHHRLLHLGFSHKNATLILAMANSMVIFLAFLTNGLNIHLHLFVTVIFGVTIFLIPFLGLFETKSKNADPKREKVLYPKGNGEILISKVDELENLNQNELLDKVTSQESYIPNHQTEEVPLDTMYQNRSGNISFIKKKARFKDKSKGTVNQ